MGNNTNHVGGRAIIAYKWITGTVDTLLDAGCEDGNGAALFAKKARRVWGIDVNEKGIEKAKNNFPDISFSRCGIEKTPFEDSFFDVVVMNDVLEHVQDETIALNEVFRILKTGGQAVITTPHKGTFAFMDPANYKFLIKNRTLLGLLYGKKREQAAVTREGFHRHYTLSQMKSILGRSLFSEHYKIEKVFRSGFLLGVLGVNMKVVLRRLIGEQAAAFITFPIYWLAAIESRIPFGRFSYNIAVSLRKL